MAQAYIVLRNRPHAGRVWLRPAPRGPAEEAAFRQAEADGHLVALPGGPLGCTHAADGVYAMAEACNTPWLGHDARMAPGARVDDGALSVVLVRRKSRLALLRGFLRLEHGTHVRLPNVEAYACAACAFEPRPRAGAPGAIVEVDGAPLRARSIGVTRLLDPAGRPLSVTMAIHPSLAQPTVRPMR
mmetsp:Transcript_4760/g.15823  ORF Transcript_4760/g.15823 Transcript_4760/m.15823 type:complete len:186 (+) Transcript_4760:1-558(+)